MSLELWYDCIGFAHFLIKWQMCVPLQPPGFAAMKHLLVNGHLEPVRSWRRNHHGRNFCGVGPQHGRWNAWCPSGVDIDPTEANPVKEEKKQGEKKEKCPFKANVDQAKKTAESFQEMTPDFLVGLGNTIATILSQFGKRNMCCV